MGDADITTSQWRLVEVGRVVLFGAGPYEGRIAAIVEIIDHKRVRFSLENGFSLRTEWLTGT
jgi:large subunit ribosomal protein L14e